MNKRGRKLCWSNFNWVFLLAMLAGFAVGIVFITAIGSLIGGN